MQRRRRAARIQVRATFSERRAVRVMAGVKGIPRGDLLRKYSLDQVVELYRAHTGQSAASV